MKSSIHTALWLLGALACLLAIVEASAENRKLIWYDNFDKPYLDKNIWDIEVQCWGGGNLEKQCYTDHPDNIFIEDGHLKLKAISGQYMGSVEYCTLNNENSCTWTQPSTSGRIRTKRSLYGSWLYGRFEVRAKLPKGDFLWPAFWMLPTDEVYGTWAASGEIDIMEFRGQDRSKYASTLHFGGKWPNNMYNSSGDLDMGQDLTADFHVYACEWSKDMVTFYFDDTKIFEYSLNQKLADMYTKKGSPFDQRFHVILNLAVGGNFFDPEKYGCFNDSSVKSWENPVLEIDYVKVYGEPNSSSSNLSLRDIRTMLMNLAGAESTLPIYPESDTFVDNMVPRLVFNHESVISLRSSCGTGRERVAYFKFYIPLKTPSAAALLLHGSLDEDSPTIATVNVHNVPDNAWNGAFMCYEHKPNWDSSAVSAQITNEIKWTMWDVKSLIDAAIQQNVNVVTFAVRIDSPSGVHALFESSDSDSIDKPMLLLAY